MKIRVFVILVLLFLFILLKGSEAEPKIGLVLSGGGARGLAHIGVLKVLEEYKIMPDYITGTSMGSIIGALYSLGYTAAEIEDIVMSQDWDELLYDHVPMSRLSLEEKNDQSRYIGSFPIEGYKIMLPKSLVTGQNVSQLLTRLTISAHQVEDFSNLPISFLCIATDIETGEAVILDSGYLPEAIRASMSIPSLFCPVEYEGRLLVDGGLVRNLPVTDCLNMGADFIIGVDVGNGLYKREELNSLVRIMEQSIAFQGAASTREERKLADILIEPEVDEFGITEFNEADKLIALGASAALKVEDKLTELSSRLNKKYEPIPNANPELIYLEDIVFSGLEQVSKNLVLGKMRLKKSSRVSIDKIDSAISQLYGSGYFERVIYRLEWDNNGYILQIRVWEKNTKLFRVGFHYDSDRKAGVLLNTTFRNFAVMGSKISIDLQLGDYQYFRWAEFVHTGWEPGFGVGWDAYYNKFKFNIRDRKGTQLARFNIELTGSVIDLKTIFSNSFAVGSNIECVNIKSTGEFVPPEWGNADNETFWLRNSFYARIDNVDRAVYSTQGIKLYVEGRNYYSLKTNADTDKEFRRFILDGEVLIALSHRLSFASGGFLGFLDTHNLPYEERLYFGGLLEKDNSRPFMGLNFGEVAAEEGYLGRLRLQYEPWDGKFIILRYDFARIISDFPYSPSENFVMRGYGLSLGMQTPIGPIELTLMGSSRRPDEIRSYISIGYGIIDN
ncbi:MAG: patatin-like phospholipase family protein [Candidatus Cloacimonetes bacterium]|nr:patatin-like phospholipase family protein [Candidatus Cloacimonadota bacterium]